MRSFARERSSSRRAPPMAASKLPACSASSSDLVLSSPQQRCVPTLNGWVPSAIASSFVWTIEPRADGPRHLVAELDHLAELVGGIDVEQRKRDRARVERLLCQAEQDRRVLADGVEHHRPFEFGDDLAEDVDALGLQRPQVIEAGAATVESGVRATVDILSKTSKKKPGWLSPGFDRVACSGLILLFTQLPDRHHGDPLQVLLQQQQTQRRQIRTDIELDSTRQPPERKRSSLGP